MTPEVSIGTISTSSIGPAITPSVSGGISESFSAPNIKSSLSPTALDTGGSFMEKASFASIFSETKPFAPSLQTTPEMPIASSDIFSSKGWDILSTPKIKAESPNHFNPSEFKPFIASDNPTKEKPVDIQKDEWVTITKKPELNISKIEQVLEDEPGILEKPAVKAKTKEVDFELQEGQNLVKVRALLARLTQEVEEEDLIEEEEEQEDEVGAREKILFVEAESATSESDEFNAHKEDKSKTKRAQVADSTPAGLDWEVDLNAQENRWKSFKNAISKAFLEARILKTKAVDPREVAGNVTEKRETKSKLLSQIKWEQMPDGSFHEAIEDASNMGKTGDLSLASEREMQIRVAKILEEKRPVKIPEDGNSINKATNKEAKRVLKFARFFQWA